MMRSFCYFGRDFCQKNPEFPCEQYPRCNLDDMNEAECLAELKFAKHDIPRLAEVLQIP